MNGSFQIARIFGIPVLLHWSFGLLFFYVLYIGNKQNLESHQLLWLGLFVLAMFVCIVFHEFGHALTARRYGVDTKDIILLPIGGVARLMRLPEKPFQEFMVAIAGPLVNVAIAILLLPYFFIVNFTELFSRDVSGETDLIGDYYFFIPALIMLNLMLAVFNLLPAFPMDGGRILRALLAIKLGRLKATRIASLLGQFIAVLMFAYGIKEDSLTTSFIGVFIFFTAARENRWVRAESLLSKFTVKEVLRSRFTKLNISDSILPVYGSLLNNGERNFLVFDEGNYPVGTLSDWAIMEAAKNEQSNPVVGQHFQPGVLVANIEDTLVQIREKMHQSESNILPVFDKDELIGVVDYATVQNFLSAKKGFPE